MCLLKKIVSPPDNRINKKPCILPLDNLLQRGYLEGIGWSPMAMLLEIANGFIMVRHVLYVCRGALPSNILLLCWVYFLLLSANIVKIKCYVCCKWCKWDNCTFFPGCNFSGHSLVFIFWHIFQHSQKTVPFFQLYFFLVIFTTPQLYCTLNTFVKSITISHQDQKTNTTPQLYCTLST